MTVSKPPPTTSTTDADIGARLERLPHTRFHRTAVAILSTCYVIDTIDISMLGFLLSAVSRDLGLSPGGAGLAASAGLIGMGIGATVAGWMADRWGRRRILVGSMVLWGLASLATAFAWNLESFMIFRIITGLGLGAEIPAAVALLAEFLGKGRRARSMGIVQTSAAIGLTGFNALSLLAVTIAGAVFGWRIMFAVMFFAAVFAFYVRRALPESPRWYASRGHIAEAEARMQAIERQVEAEYGRPLPPPEPLAVRIEPTERSSFLQLFRRDIVGRTLLVWALWSSMLFAAYAISTWIGKLLVDRGMSISGSILIGTLIALGGIPGGLVSGRLMERFGRKKTLAAMLTLHALAAFGYGHATSTTWIVIAGALMQFALIAEGTALYSYTPELFPTAARATGMGTASTAGRIAAVAAPLSVPAMIIGLGYTGSFIAFAGFFLLAAVLVVVFGPETRSRTLEEISG